MNILAAVAEAERIGREDVEACVREPSLLSALPIGSFSRQQSFRALQLRRLCVRMNVPPTWLALLGRRLLSGARLSGFNEFLLRLAYWRGVRRARAEGYGWTSLSRGPLILMYHAVGCRGEASSRYVIPCRRFALQMAWLKCRRFRIVRLSELATLLQRHVVPPPRTVAITFDDGYRDNHDLALPILRQHGFPATFFLVTAAGGAATWTADSALAGRPLLSDDQVLRLLDAGMEVGAHTRRHVSLTDATPMERDIEVRGSRDDLERKVGRPVQLFAYPFGDCDAESVSTVSAAGFRAACGSRSGVNDPSTPLLQLRRLEIRGTDTLAAFAMSLWRAHRPTPVPGRAQTERVVA